MPHLLSACTVASLLALTLHLGPAQALAATTNTQFQPITEVQGTPLQLNGKGTRRRGIFNGYDMALYTTQPVSTAEELLNLPGPKKLQFVALRNLATTDLGRQFVKAMGENAPKEMTQKHSLSALRLIEIFSARPKVAAGEAFAIEFIPGKGTLFSLLGEPQGAPMGDEEFFSMVLNIWVGPAPADTLLKEGLLGRE